MGRFVYRFDNGTKVWDNATGVIGTGHIDDKKFDVKVGYGFTTFDDLPRVAQGWKATTSDMYTYKNYAPVVDGFLGAYRPLRASCVGNLCLRAKGNVVSPYIFLKLNDSNSNKQWGYAVLLQSQGEMVIKKRRSETFEATSPHMKLLQMRTADGKVVPMNEATFKKYNQPLKIGVE